ncbi:TorF family putative porin [Idiomarina sp. PL1-037]|uniref:TorF family putative porin n=1 Tax=Idiomarina sp. PL1-037 TaxID=3095365 RepID=UPI002ACC1CAE|nr:TorF family putative porin [Idiomarina sp. PL1-037]WQC53103.1 TorF family putative porin [Idiomarina sp. PL1-037]
MHLKAINTALFFGLLVSGTSQASWDLTATATSDYLFNGVTQTSDDPALQFIANKNFDNGWYAGGFASNVDFGDDTWLELDAFGGRYWQMNDEIGVELGALYYSYYGEGSDINYTETTAAVDVSDFRFQLWYAWDYAGTDAKHLVAAVFYQVYSDGENGVNLGFSQSRSLDSEDFQWDTRDHYNHAWIAYDRNWQQWNFMVSYNHTTLSSDWGGGNTLTANVTYTF